MAEPDIQLPWTVEHNENGLEVWWSSRGHAALDGLSPDECARLLVAHAPDFSAEQIRELRRIFWSKTDRFRDNQRPGL